MSMSLRVQYEGVAVLPIISHATYIWLQPRPLGSASHPKHHTNMDIVATPRRSIKATAASQSREWLTATMFEDIVGVMTDAHEGSGPAPATQVDTNRLHLLPSSRDAMNVFVAHQRSSTVFETRNKANLKPCTFSVISTT